jgi:hypothetical protein
MFTTMNREFQLYHTENKLIFDEMIMVRTFYFSNTLNMDSANSLKQQSAGRYFSPFRHIFPTQNQPVLVFAP